MLIQKETHLQFLSVFLEFSDTTRVTHDKVKIVADSIKNTIIFSLFTDQGGVIYVTPNLENDNFTVVYPIQQFYNFINTLPKDEQVILKDYKITVKSSKSEYTFENYDLVVADESKYLKLLTTDPKIVYNIKSLDKLKIASNFTGKPTANNNEKLDTVGIFGDKFVATDRSQSACIIKTDNSISKFFLSQRMVKLLMNSKLESVNILEYETNNMNLYYLTFDNNLHYFFPIRSYNLPDLTASEVAINYNHQFKIELEKEKMLSSINRMHLFSYINANSKIYLKCENENSIKLLNKEHNKSFEILPTTNTLDKEIIGKEYALSSETLKKLITLSNDSKILSLYVDDNPDEMVLLKILTDNSDYIFLQVLLE